MGAAGVSLDVGPAFTLFTIARPTHIDVNADLSAQWYYDTPNNLGWEVLPDVSGAVNGSVLLGARADECGSPRVPVCPYEPAGKAHERLRGVVARVQPRGQRPGEALQGRSQDPPADRARGSGIPYDLAADREDHHPGAAIGAGVPVEQPRRTAGDRPPPGRVAEGEAEITQPPRG